MKWPAANGVHLLILQPLGQVARDITGSVVAEQTGFSRPTAWSQPDTARADSIVSVMPSKRIPKHLKTYEQREQKVLIGQKVLASVIEPLLKSRTEALHQVAVLTKDMTRHSRDNETCRSLMKIPIIGAVSDVKFVATIGTLDRFKNSRSVGTYIGLTSRRY